MTESTNWLTAAAFAALFSFIAKQFIEAWASMVRRAHLLSALGAYVSNASERYITAENEFNFEALKIKLHDDVNFTPFILYDPTPGFTIDVIRQDYGFLDSDVMDSVVSYIYAESYLQILCREFRSEYVRGFSQERKLGILIEYKRAQSFARERSKIANDQLKELRSRTIMGWLCQALD